MEGNYYELLMEFAVTDFKLRYKRSLLGFLWAIFKPVFLFIILYFVWIKINTVENNYFLYIFSGIIFLDYFRNGINYGMQSLVYKSEVILKINFPREVVVFASLFPALFNFVVNLVILLIIALIAGIKLYFASVMIFLLSITATSLFIIAVSLFLSVQHIIFRDLDHIIDLILQVLFWITPVLYKIDRFESGFIKSIIQINPLTYLLEFFRKAFVTKITITLADISSLIMFCSINLMFIILGIFYLRSKIKKISENF